MMGRPEAWASHCFNLEKRRSDETHEMRQQNGCAVGVGCFFHTGIQAFWRLQNGHRKTLSGFSRVGFASLAVVSSAAVRPQGNQLNFAMLAPLC
jgi:hypothetical protein